MGTTGPNTTSELTVIASERPRVVEHYSGYSPPFDVVPLIEGMLRSVPPRYLVGLSEIVLTNTTGLSRKMRRSVTKARGRKVRIVEARGLYRQEWHGEPAWIQIFVDNTLRGYERGWWRLLLQLSYFRENELGGVLFHEIGHHIDRAIRPEFREKEDIADDWSAKLRRHWFRTKRPGLVKLFRLFMPIMRFGARLLAERMLNNGSISRSRYDAYMKSFRS